MTDIERLMAAALTRAGVRYEFNRPMGVVQPDFYLPDYAAVIECDSEYWHRRPRQRRRDAQKNAWYAVHGLRCHRFWGRAIKTDPDGCVRLVVLAHAQRPQDGGASA